MTHLTLVGDYDLQRRSQLSQALAVAEAADVAVLDFSRVRYIDASVLGCLVGLKRKMIHNGRRGTVRITHANALIARLFQMCELEQFLQSPRHAEGFPRRRFRVAV